MKVHIIQQDEWVAPGEHLNWAVRHGYEVSLSKCWEYDTLPAEPNTDMLVVLGGLQCPATTLEECNYFDAENEKRCIKRYIDAGQIVIGSCLGAQLIGEAVGARYEHSLFREVGCVEAHLTEAGRHDPFFAHLPFLLQDRTKSCAVLLAAG